MPGLVARQDAERVFHDQQASARQETFRTSPERLRFTDAEFLDHETWIRPAFAHFGDMRGKTALDYGCGHGMAAVVMARAGAKVSAFDLSPGYVAEAEARAAANGVRVTCHVAAGESLPYADASFDIVWGNAILHHLDLQLAGAELYRVLKPGGVAVFAEPWGQNPVLNFARARLPYPGKGHTDDEAPLRGRDLAPLCEHFPELTWQGYQLFGMAQRLIGPRWARPLHTLDRISFAACPRLKNWARYVVIVLNRR
ncbi:MAG: class I SAM-dependent methyltransferase [Fimbriiglobus sp.]